MKAEHIRSITFPKHEFGNPPSEVHEFLGAMLQEIAAQLAELNDNLKQPFTVSTHPSESPDG